MISSYGLRPAGEVGAPDMMPGVQAPLPLKSPSETSPAQPSGESFASMLGHMVEEVNARQGAATDAVAALQSGQNVSLHQAVIAMEEANISFQLMVEVRNKLLDSYQELMRMQV
jgi:flagellar hook-basal body complex protein FliE